MKMKFSPVRRPKKPARTGLPEIGVPSASRAFPVIAMAASVGGLKALSVILGGLPGDFPAAIAIVMHVAPDHKSLLAEILNRRVHLVVKEAHTGDRLCPACAFIAPPNHHLLVANDGRLKLSSAVAEKIHFARPSAELLFASVARVYKNHAIAVVLTGGDGDGSFGVQTNVAAGTLSTTAAAWRCRTEASGCSSSSPSAPGESIAVMRQARYGPKAATNAPAATCARLCGG